METYEEREKSITSQACISGSVIFHSMNDLSTSKDLMRTAKQAFDNAMKLEQGGERISYLSCFKNAAEFLKNKPGHTLTDYPTKTEKELFEITKDLYLFNKQNKK